MYFASFPYDLKFSIVSASTKSFKEVNDSRENKTHFIKNSFYLEMYRYKPANSFKTVTSNVEEPEQFGRNRLEGPAVAPAQMKKKTFFLRHNIG